MLSIDGHLIVNPLLNSQHPPNSAEERQVKYCLVTIEETRY